MLVKFESCSSFLTALKNKDAEHSELYLQSSFPLRLSQGVQKVAFQANVLLMTHPLILVSIIYITTLAG